VPLSGAAEKVLRARPQLLPAFFGCGDDYEILATVPPDAQASFESAAESAGVSLRRIGDIEAVRPAAGDARIAFLDSGGQPLDLPIAGYTHFAAGEES
jgi:thiamine-monophosphate kinase